MTFPQLFQFADLALLVLRIMAGVIFVGGGLGHLKDPSGRAKRFGLSVAFTIFLGVAEVAGGLGVMFGVLTQLAAMGLIAIMLGAIYQKMFVRVSGFWGKDYSGWHYDLLFVVMNLVIITTGGGRFVLLK